MNIVKDMSPESTTADMSLSNLSESGDAGAAELADTPLDQLFSALAEETKNSKTDENTESPFDAIQKQIENLPKIESGLEASMRKAANEKASRSLIVKINDPVTTQRKVKNEEKTDSGSDWFNMGKPELTPELKRDLLILKNRSVLDPKRHYKKEKWQVPKYFQTGTIIQGNTEFFSSRLTKKNRGKSIAEEILRDTDTTEYFKRKYTEIHKASKSGGKAHYKKLQAKRRGY